MLKEVQNYRDGKCINDNTSPKDGSGTKDSASTKDNTSAKGNASTTDNTSTKDNTNANHCPQNPREERDTIIYDLKIIIDRNYENYAGSFERTEDTSIFLGETSAASLTAVATLVGASPTKDILTTASTLVQSTSVSAQKNFYQKQTSYAILNVMDSDRATKWAAIYDLMVKYGIDKYPLSAALSNLLDYRKAGTALQALTSIQQTAGATKATAAVDIKNTNAALGAPTPQTPPQNPQAAPQSPQAPRQNPQTPPQTPQPPQ